LVALSMSRFHKYIYPPIVSRTTVTDATASDDLVEAFVEHVEAELGHEIFVDEHMGDDLGWFFVETDVEIGGETFEAEVDFNLSKTSVSPLYAEIYHPQSEEEGKQILDNHAECIERSDTELLYEYRPERDELGDILEDLKTTHDTVFN